MGNQAANNAQISSVVADTQGVKTQGSTVSMGSFKLTAKVGDTIESISLTDDQGKSWVYVDGDLNKKVQATPIAASATLDCGLEIEYVDGAGTETDAEILSIWLATIGNNSVTINVSSNNAAVKFLASATPTDWAGEASTSITATNSVLKGVTFTSKKASVAKVDSVYVGVSGKEEVEDEASYTVTFTPANPLA